MVCSHQKYALSILKQSFLGIDYLGLGAGEDFFDVVFLRLGTGLGKGLNVGSTAHIIFSC